MEEGLRGTPREEGGRREGGGGGREEEEGGRRRRGEGEEGREGGREKGGEAVGTSSTTPLPVNFAAEYWMKPTSPLHHS